MATTTTAPRLVVCGGNGFLGTPSPSFSIPHTRTTNPHRLPYLQIRRLSWLDRNVHQPLRHPRLDTRHGHPYTTRMGR